LRQALTIRIVGGLGADLLQVAQRRADLTPRAHKGLGDLLDHGGLAALEHFSIGGEAVARAIDQKHQTHSGNLRGTNHVPMSSSAWSQCAPSSGVTSLKF